MNIPHTQDISGDRAHSNTKYSCPVCGRIDALSVNVLTAARLIQQPGLPNTTRIDGSLHDWDAFSTMWCACGYCDCSVSFRDPQEPELENSSSPSSKPLPGSNAAPPSVPRASTPSDLTVYACSGYLNQPNSHLATSPAFYAHSLGCYLRGTGRTQPYDVRLSRGNRIRADGMLFRILEKPGKPVTFERIN
jgi:hypothetical protein